jgi:nucleotide-binding universal stress UspA family protein
MYKKIFIAIDNSSYSNYCIDLGINISQKFDSHLVGCHVYDATLHQRRFRDMEKGLPPQYQDENVLQRQRDLHTSLINMGLRLISESYLDVFKNKCHEAHVSHEELLLEGKNYYEIIKELQQGCYDLVIIGAFGLAAVNDYVIGSVCERVAKRTKTDILIVKNNRLEGKVVLAADGSIPSVSGVTPAVTFARSFNLKLNAVSVFDPHYHRVAFESIAKVLSKEAGQIFRFKDQETLHEEIIDKGLAKIYQNHLDQVRCMVKDSGVEIDTVLMDGKPYDQILKYIYKESPSLLVLGRTGVHNTHGLDLGSTTENLLRFAPCNILLTGGNVEAKSGVSVSFSETRKSPDKEINNQRTSKESNSRLSKLLPWTEEAQQQTERIPSFIRGVVRKKIEEYAQERGYPEITTEVVNEAKTGLMNDDSSHKV